MSDLTSSIKSILFFSVIYRTDLCKEPLSFLSEEFQVNWRASFRPRHQALLSYYEKEMGHPLARVILVAYDLIRQDQLVDFKVKADQLEKRSNPRVINIDPGLLNPYQMTLATGKMFAHRLYLGKGVYGDLSYVYEKKQFQALSWCYPDYKEQDMINFFTMLRTQMMRQLKG